MCTPAALSKLFRVNKLFDHFSEEHIREIYTLIYKTEFTQPIKPDDEWQFFILNCLNEMEDNIAEYTIWITPNKILENYIKLNIGNVKMINTITSVMMKADKYEKDRTEHIFLEPDKFFGIYTDYFHLIFSKYIIEDILYEYYKLGHTGYILYLVKDTKSNINIRAFLRKYYKKLDKEFFMEFVEDVKKATQVASLPQVNQSKPNSNISLNNYPLYNTTDIQIIGKELAKLCNVCWIHSYNYDNKEFKYFLKQIKELVEYYGFTYDAKYVCVKVKGSDHDYFIFSDEPNIEYSYNEVKSHFIIGAHNFLKCVKDIKTKNNLKYDIMLVVNKQFILSQLAEEQAMEQKLYNIKIVDVNDPDPDTLKTVNIGNEVGTPFYFNKINGKNSYKYSVNFDETLMKLT